MIAGQDECFSRQSLTATIFSLCCFLPFGLTAGKTVDNTWTGMENVVTRQGDTALLRCYLLDELSKGAWLNRSSIIFAGDDKWSVDPRVSIVSGPGSKHEYSLQIQKVDVTDDGQYTCSVQSKHNPQSNQIHLSVKVPPKIYDISHNITVNEGSDVSLHCMADGKPEPTISWRHVTPFAKKFEPGRHLMINGVSRDQAGDYECSAQNDVSFPDTKKVRVTVDFPPTIQEMKSSGVSSERIVLVRCEAAAMPPPMFEWYRGKKRLTKGQGIEIKNLSSRSILSMTNVTEDRFDNYTCVAVNKLGSANASVPLNLAIIESTTTSLILPTAPNTASYGSTGSADVLLSCRYLILALSSLVSGY